MKNIFKFLHFSMPDAISIFAWLGLFLLAGLGGPRSAAAQVGAFGAVGSTSSVTASSATAAVVVPSTYSPYGIFLPIDKGPWVLGDVKFLGVTTISDYALQSKVRARRGTLYMPEDVQGDVKSLMDTGSFSKVEPAVYAIPDQPVPAGFASIAVSTSMVRLVFNILEKQGAGTPGGVAASTSTATGKPPLKLPPAAVSGMVMTPTAYRGFGKVNEPGLGLDINAMYYIGRLYGKNHFGYTPEHTNYLDRVGQWFLGLDGKAQLQSEATIRPAAAVGGQAYFTFRDGPKPGVNALPGVTVDLSQQGSQKANTLASDAYFVLSKKLSNRFGGVRSSVGFMEGNFGNSIGQLSEFLAPDHLLFDGHRNQVAAANTVFFYNLFAIPKPSYPLGVEFLKPEGMVLSPWLLNFKLGYFLHLNFDISYLHFTGGWDLLGNFSFRTVYFPLK